MLETMYQIQKYLAAHHGLTFEEGGLFASRVVGRIPDGEHLIPIGADRVPTRVAVRNGFVWLGDDLNGPGVGPQHSADVGVAT